MDGKGLSNLNWGEMIFIEGWARSNEIRKAGFLLEVNIHTSAASAV